jgi:hypothetical protein
MWFLKSPFDQNSIMIYHKSHGNFKDISFLEGHKSDIGMTSRITHIKQKRSTILGQYKTYE